ncbi:MAG TPA: tripartite tricarboxylate transporter substrate binding protein [Burkholderiales bacterium]|nr:tripartite tricarboxylate transporter substrate binding protein [Burkholderiales bacterium]
MKRILAALALLSVFCAAPAAAQYPNRPIRLVVPFTPGTGIDILARVFAQKLQDRTKNPVVVENRPGASGNIGTEAVARAPADGYTLLMTATTIVQSAVLYKTVPYDPKAMTPIGLAAIGNLSLVANPSVPARSVAELVAYAKAHPGMLNYASPGSATPHHLAMEQFKLHFGVHLVHVPYKGTAGAVTDLLGGQIQLMFLPVHVALPQVQAGKLVMLASGGAQRSPATPEVPSLAEAGMRDIDVDIWYALLGPAGLPREVVALLNAELAAILGDADTRASLLKQGLSPRTGTPAELGKLIENDLERWGRVVREARITAD